MLIVDGLNASWHVDPMVLDHLREGRVSAVNGTVAANHDTLWTLGTISRVLDHLNRNAERAMLVETAEDIHLAHQAGKVGYILGLQDTVPLGEDLSLMPAFHRLGIRVVQLTYNFENRAGCGCLCAEDTGLTSFGRQVLAECNRLGILIDLSHCGRRTTREAIELSDRPVAITHSNAISTLDHPRNKPIDIINALVSRGGVIGAVAVPPMLTTNPAPTIDDYVHAIADLVEIAGPNHVGLGADFMEAMPPEVAATVTSGLSADAVKAFASLPTIAGFESPADYPRVAERLAARRMPADTVERVMGLNWLRIYEETWAA